jgi:hypothetical protein
MASQPSGCILALYHAGKTDTVRMIPYAGCGDGRCIEFRSPSPKHEHLEVAGKTPLSDDHILELNQAFHV